MNSVSTLTRSSSPVSVEAGVFYNRSKYHFLTWSNLEDEDPEKDIHFLAVELVNQFTRQFGDPECIPLKYMIACAERHKNGIPHCHALLYFPAPKMVTVNNLLFFKGQRPQLQKIQKYSSPEAAIAYIKKDGSFFEYGEIPKVQRSRSRNATQLPTKLEDVPLEVRENRIANTTLMAKPAQDLLKEGLIPYPNYVKYDKLYSLYTLQEKLTSHKREVKVYWIYGPTGIGKSNYVRTQYKPEDIYLKQNTKWWDGYINQPVVLIEEFQDHSMLSLMKIWADVYFFNAEYKGGSLTPKYSTLFITSNYLPQEIWPTTYSSKKGDEESVKAMFRRMTLTTILGQTVLADFNPDSPPPTHKSTTIKDLEEHRDQECWLQYKPETKEPLPNTRLVKPYIK